MIKYIFYRNDQLIYNPKIKELFLECEKMNVHPVDIYRTMPEFIGPHYKINESILVSTKGDITDFLKKRFNRIPVNYNLEKSIHKYFDREREVVTLEYLKDNTHKYLNKVIKFSNSLDLSIEHFKTLDQFEKVFKKIGNKDDEEILVSDFIENIVSEWTVYVYNQKHIYLVCETGDYFRLPNQYFVEEIIKNFDDQPIAYSFNVAITKDREHFLINIKDIIYTENMGVQPLLFAKMYLDRWEEFIYDK